MKEDLESVVADFRARIAEVGVQFNHRRSGPIAHSL